MGSLLFGWVWRMLRRRFCRMSIRQRSENKMKLIQESITLPQLYTVPETTIQVRDRLLEEMDRALEGIEQIEDAEQLNLVNEQGRQLQRHKKETQEDRLALGRKIDAAGKALIAHERNYLAPIEAGLVKRDALMTDWRQRER